MEAQLRTREADIPIKIVKRPALIVPPALVVPASALAHKPRAPSRERPLDNLCRAALSVGHGAAVSWFLMASYLYYVHDKSLLTDDMYDDLGKTLKAHYSSIKHQHKHLITQKHLEMGSMFDLRERDYPLMVRHAAAHLARHDWGVKIPTVL